MVLSFWYRNREYPFLFQCIGEGVGGDGGGGKEEEVSQAVKYHRLCARRNCYAVLKGRRELFITTGFLTLCRDKIMLYLKTLGFH